MTLLKIPTPLRAYTSGQSEVNVAGAKISEALTDLANQYPALKPHLFNDSGGLRPFVNLFVGEHNIKDLQGMNTPIKDGDRIMLIPSIAGGKPYRCEGDVLLPEAISTHNEIASLRQAQDTASRRASALLATTYNNGRNP